MRTRRALLCLFMLIVSVAAVFSQGTITPVFPSKDGTISPDSCSGDQKELFADSARQAAGWMVFKLSGVNYMNINSAMLAVSIKTVRKPGLCGIHSLMTKIIPPENRVAQSDVRFDDMPLAAQPLDSTFSDKIILVNITEELLSGKFCGIALRSLRGLSASFNSKEGFPPSAILVYRDSLNPYAQPKWWSAEDVPDTSVGKEGDFYVRAAQGIIYRKSPGVWDSVASLTIPPPLPEAAAQHQKPLHRPARRIPRR